MKMHSAIIMAHVQAGRGSPMAKGTSLRTLPGVVEGPAKASHSQVASDLQKEGI